LSKQALLVLALAATLFTRRSLPQLKDYRSVRSGPGKTVKLTWRKQRYPDAVITDNSDDVINDPDTELVVIATPNDSHHTLGKQALLAGKHVVMDKPFTITSADADDLIKIAKQQEQGTFCSS
jgi:predicted dehydrogenase